MEVKREGEAAKKVAADYFVSLIEELGPTQSDLVVGIPGGNSVKPLLDGLVSSQVFLGNVHFFWVDERFVPLDDEDSNYKQAWDYALKDLVGSGRIPKENLHPFPYNPIDEGQDLQTYYDQFRDLGEVFHILVLASGEDGHVASLFPGHDYWQKAQPALFFERNSPKPPPTRVTFGPPVFQDSEHSILLFFGEGKRAALDHFLNPNVDPGDCPAKVIEENENLVVYTDLD